MLKQAEFVMTAALPSANPALLRYFHQKFKSHQTDILRRSTRSCWRYTTWKEAWLQTDGPASKASGTAGRGVHVCVHPNALVDSWCSVINTVVNSP